MPRGYGVSMLGCLQKSKNLLLRSRVDSISIYHFVPLWSKSILLKSVDSLSNRNNIYNICEWNLQDSIAAVLWFKRFTSYIQTMRKGPFQNMILLSFYLCAVVQHATCVMMRMIMMKNTWRHLNNNQVVEHQGHLANKTSVLHKWWKITSLPSKWRNSERKWSTINKLLLLGLLHRNPTRWIFLFFIWYLELPSPLSKSVVPACCVP